MRARIRQVVVGDRIEVAELARATLAPDQVRVEVAYVGICGSELHRLEDPRRYDWTSMGSYDAMPSGEVDPAGDASYGHEYSGIVREVGAEVRSVRVGDRVVGMPRWPCLSCRQCRAGLAIYCRRFTTPARGAWADEIVVPEQAALRVPDAVSLRDAALWEPLSCALRGIDQARAPAGGVALVIGGGPIGLLTALLAVRFGAREVVLSEPRPYRRAIAAGLGAIAVDPHERELSELVGAHTGGLGFDVVYEAVGRPESIAEAVELVAPGGTVVVLGVPPTQAVAPIRPWRLFQHEVVLTAAFGPELVFPRALELLPALDVAPIATHVLGLERVEAAIALSRSGDCGKVLLAPAGEAAA